MPRVSLAFFLTGAVLGLLGMIWGAYMGVNEDFTQRDAHAHLNLVGWVSLAVMGAFYALAGPARPQRLSWVNYVLSSLGVVLFVPNLALIPLGGQTGLPIAGIFGVMLVMAGMACFIVAVAMQLISKRRA